MSSNGIGLVVAIALSFGVSLSAQKPETGPDAPSKKGDTIVVQGCVSGPLLKDLRHQKSEQLTKAETSLVYRLVGDKKLLKIIQKEHQDQVLEVTGLIESNPNNTSTTHTKEMGRVRLYVGTGEQEVSQANKPPTYPILRVTSFEVLRTNCLV
jgi:hypothetical protein